MEEFNESYDHVPKRYYDQIPIYVEPVVKEIIAAAPSNTIRDNPNIQRRWYSNKFHYLVEYEDGYREWVPWTRVMYTNVFKEWQQKHGPSERSKTPPPQYTPSPTKTRSNTKLNR